MLLQGSHRLLSVKEGSILDFAEGLAEGRLLAYLLQERVEWFWVGRCQKQGGILLIVFRTRTCLCAALTLSVAGGGQVIVDGALS